MKKAFTLVELLVVIAVIGILSAIITPNLLNARSNAKIAAGQRFDSSVYHSIGDYLVGEWMFDVPTSPLIDTSGFVNNGSTSSIDTSPTYFSTGGYNNKGAYSFDSGDLVSFGDPAILDIRQNSVSISVWVKPSVDIKDMSANYPIIFDKRPWGVGGFELASSKASDTLYWQYCWTGSYKTISFPVGALKAGNWYHVVGTLGGINMMAYIDGKLVSSSNTATAIMGSSAGTNATIGGSWQGLIDDIRIYSSALSSSEVEKLYVEGAKAHGLSGI